jgi:fructose-specific component phosphotransferase system IIB-like protein
MGAALRHAGHLLSGRQADKKLLLVLTDGQPADVDVADPQHLIADAAQAVRELDQLGRCTPTASAWTPRPMPTWARSSAAAGPWWTGWSNCRGGCRRFFSG